VVDLVETNTGRVRVETTSGEIEARAVVVCAGLWSSQLAKRAGLVTDVQIVPFRGTWLALRPSGADLVRGNIYPVPDPELPFLGVHFTRRVDGSVWSGPNAVLSLAERAVVRDALRFAGLWRLGVREGRVAVREFYLSHWHGAALRELNRYIPELRHDDVDWSNRPSGVRAQAVRRDGSLVDDFVIEGNGRVVWVLNAPSPAATASLAIGEVLAGEALSRL
jgi:L-2-hydroxyglutarate oxidase LhgO